VLASQRIEWPFEGDKVTRYEPCSLMNQLVNECWPLVPGSPSRSGWLPE